MGLTEGIDDPEAGKQIGIPEVFSFQAVPALMAEPFHQPLCLTLHLQLVGGKLRASLPGRSAQKVHFRGFPQVCLPVEIVTGVRGQYPL